MIEISNLSKTYSDGTHALRDISLSLPTGMVGLLGPNGAGKSSLMRTLVGLQSADEGSIMFEGSDVLKHPEHIRSTLGYLPQYFGVYPNMSCLALLKHMAVLKGLNASQQKEQIPKLLELTNLTEFSKKSVSQFSGGMKQRFGIAQALLGNPKVVIMDEPTAGLDPEERERLHDMLVSISAKRLILLSTHIVEDVENLCHHAALMFNGQVHVSDAVSAHIASIENKIWVMPTPPADFLLNKSFKFGEPIYRVYAEHQPDPQAIQVQATLQDKYFQAKNLAGPQ